MVVIQKKKKKRKERKDKQKSKHISFEELIKLLIANF